MSTLNVDDINLGGRVNGFKGADIASATTTDISAATGNLVHITGTTTITGLGTASQAGVKRTLVFDGILTLTNGANLLLPGAENIVTAAGDSATFVADTTTIWKCISYTRLALNTAAGGGLLARQILASGTTYTPTSGTKSAVVQMWAAGGAGGSATNVAGGANGGGGSGGYAEYKLSNVTGTYAYTIGVGGTAVAGAAGNAGGNSTFVDGGTTITAYGGAGGLFLAGTAATKYTNGGAGGVISTNGHVNGAGMRGMAGSTSATATIGKAGDGGVTSLGGNGAGGIYSSAAAAAGGAAITNTGSGGGGGGTGTTTVAAGGAGADGLIIVTEYR